MLESDPDRFDAMLRAFTWMVDQQLEAAARREGPPRHKKPRQRPEPAEELLLKSLERAVMLHVEVNAHARGSDVPGAPELIQLYAERPTGETFEAVLAPRRPLSRSAPHHLGIDEQTLLSGVDVDTARARWNAFLRPDDLLCAWGPFPREQMELEQFAGTTWVDLRTLVARRRQGSPGAPQDALAAFGGETALTSTARAHRTVQWLVRLARQLAAQPRRTLPSAA